MAIETASARWDHADRPPMNERPHVQEPLATHLSVTRPSRAHSLNPQQNIILDLSWGAVPRSIADGFLLRIILVIEIWSLEVLYLSQK